MMTCQICRNEDGPWEFADVYDNGKAKVMLICEDCANKIRKNFKKNDYTDFTNPLRGKKVEK